MRPQAYPACILFCVVIAASETVTAGTPATFQLLADSVQGFAGSVALTYADAASLSTCTLQPVTVSLSSGGRFRLS
jgi:hypothetical protein